MVGSVAAVLSGKGGTGKTSVCAGISVELAAMGAAGSTTGSSDEMPSSATATVTAMQR